MFPTMGCTMALAILLLVTPSFGYYKYKSKIPNGDIVPHPCKANYMWAGVGHLNPYGSGENNQFGHDFNEAGYKWTEELCRHDSDGDGRSNGEELGDPNCTWMEGSVPERVTGITHPGICDPFGEGICTGKDVYVDCDVKSFDESCDVIKNADVKSADFRFKEVEIPNTETNYYCQYFDLPNDRDYHIVADEGLIDQHDVVHHMILYGCPEDYEGSPTDDSPNPCDMNGENQISCSSMISLWSVGAGGTCFGEEMGYRIGLKGVKKVKLEIHYNNPSLVSGYKDSTGMRIYYQPEKPGVQDLATFMLGQTFLEIPPGEMEVEFHGSCHGDCSQYVITKPMTVVSTYNHMHYMGRKQRTEVIRDGRVVKVLADDTQYSYDNPIMHRLDEPFQIMSGDEIATTCTYSSMSKKHWVFYGEATSDEMCYAFIVVYPASALPEYTYCGSHGPLSTCEIYMGTPKYDCDWARFTNLSNPEMMVHYENLKDTCHFDGTCRRECKETIDEIKRHPCMSKKMWPLVRQIMDRYTEGSQFIGKIHSCDGAHYDDDMDCKRDCGHMCDGGSFDSSASHDKDGDYDWEMESSAAILAPMTAAILVTTFLSAAMATIVSF